MNAEKRYAAAVTLLREYCREAGHGDDVVEKIKARPGDWTRSTIFPAFAAAAQIIEDALAEMDKKTTGAGRLAALKRIAVDNYNPKFAGQFEEDGKWYICNGYQLIGSQEPFPASIPILPERPFTRPAAELFPNISDYHKITLDRAALKAHKADPANKTRHDFKPYILRDGVQNIGMNAKWALDVIAAMPQDDFTVYARRPIDPIVFAIDSEPVAILMPCRVDQPKKEDAVA